MRVPQYPNALLGNLQGGMTIYYLQQDFNSNGKNKIQSFKPVSDMKTNRHYVLTDTN